MERLEKYEKKLCFFLYGFFVVPKFSSLPQIHIEINSAKQILHFWAGVSKIKSFVSSPPANFHRTPLWNHAIERVKMFDEDRFNLQKKKKIKIS